MASNEIPPQNYISDKTKKSKEKLSDKDAVLITKEKLSQEQKNKIIEFTKNNKVSKEYLIKKGFSEKEANEILMTNEKNEVKDSIALKKISEDRKKEETNKKIKKIKESINETEQENKLMGRLGLSEYNPSSGWEKLTHGQRMLVLEQAAQETLAKIKTTAKERFTDISKMSFSANPNKWNLKSLGKKVWKNFSKAYWVDKEEKKALEEVHEGSLKPDKQILDQLVERMADMNLNVVIEEKSQKAIVQFETLDSNSSPNYQKQVVAYNELANQFARTPDSWKNQKAAKDTDSFTKNNYEKYQEIKEQYEQARTALIDAKTKIYKEKGEHEESAKEKAMNEAKDADFQIAMLQFTSTHPDVIGELKQIRDTSSFKKIFKDNETIYRGLYMGGGALARGITASTFGMIAAPLVAGIVGGLRARRKAGDKINKAFSEGRTERSFREMTPEERLALREEQVKVISDKNIDKKGLLTSIMPGMTGVNAKEVARFVDADSQMQRLTNLMQKIDTAETPMEKAQYMQQLSARIDYIEEKKRDGLINFGKENPVGVNYAFLKLVSQAEVQIAMMNKLDPLDLTPKEIQSIYDQSDKRKNLTEFVMDYNKVKSEFEQTYFKNTETAKGVVVGAGLALLGWKIRDWFHGSPHGVKGLTSQEPTKFVPFKATENPVIKTQDITKTIPSTTTHVTEKLQHLKQIVTHPKEAKVPVLKTEVIKTIEKAPLLATETTETVPQYDPAGVHDILSGKAHIDEDTIPQSDPEIDETLSQSDPTPIELPKAPPLTTYNTGGIKPISPTGSIPQPATTEFTHIPKPEGQVIGPGDESTLSRSVAPLTREAGLENHLNTNTPPQENLIPKQISREAVYKMPGGGTNHTEHIDTHTHTGKIADEPLHHLENKNDVINYAHTHHKDVIELSKPLEHHVHGMTNTTYHNATDTLFNDKKIHFSSYASYEKEVELERLFGEGSQDVGLNQSTNLYEPTVHMTYFRDTPTWPTVEKIPAKYFLGIDEETLGDPSKLPQADLDALKDAGILNDSYEFVNHRELHHLMNAYESFLKHTTSDPMQKHLAHLNAQPRDNENIEQFVARITKDLHQTKDGTLYFLKESEVTQNIYSTEDLQGNENVEIVTRHINSGFDPDAPGMIAPTRGIYHQ